VPAEASAISRNSAGDIRRAPRAAAPSGLSVNN